jgi:hypothetical protein
LKWAHIGSRAGIEPAFLIALPYLCVKVLLPFPGKGWGHRDPPIVKIKVLSARRKNELKKVFSEVRRSAASGRGGLVARTPARKPPRRAKRGAPWAAAAEGRTTKAPNLRSCAGA